MQPLIDPNTNFVLVMLPASFDHLTLAPDQIELVDLVHESNLDDLT